jgi:hypothetical protein
MHAYHVNKRLSWFALHHVVDHVFHALLDAVAVDV